MYNVIIKYICKVCFSLIFGINFCKMGKIISSRKEKDKVISEVMFDYEEYLQLKGHLDDVYLFTEHVAEIQANISQRGKNEATKYFLIPRQLRKGLKFDNAISCQKIELKDKTIFIYVIDKNKISSSRREFVRHEFSRGEFPRRELAVRRLIKERELEC